MSNLDVPEAFEPLLKPARYKGAWGGRGSGKSHFFAGWLVCRMATEAGLRAVCVREVQRSIADSVKKLIEDKIAALGLEAYFTITDAEIRGANGSLCIFRGMQNHTAASIKSLEGFHVAWVEEAQTISAKSLEILTPTIREPGSELWFSWNPENETDPVDQLLRAAPPDDAIVVKANYSDNKHFPPDLRTDMERDKRRDPDKYLHIWEGAYRLASEARIFRNYRSGDVSVPHNVVWFYGADWGFSVDPTVGVRLCFPSPGVLYVSDEVHEVGVPTDRLPKLLDDLPGSRDWPMAGDSARPETIDYLRRHGFMKLRPAIKGKGSVEDGITFLQGFDIVVSPRCPNTLNEFQRYAYKTDKQTGEILPVVEDDWNHCIAEGQRILTRRGAVPVEAVTTADQVMTRGGWRRVLWAGVTDTDREVVRVKTTLGELVCTPEHLVFSNNQFVRADALRYGDEVTGDASWSKLSNGTDTHTGAGRVRGISRAVGTFSARLGVVPADGLNTFIGPFGRLQTALSRMARTFTTAMVTPATMISTTLNASCQSSIRLDTHGTTIGGGNRLSTLIAFAISQGRGTVATRGARFTAVLADWLTLDSFQSRRNALTAADGSSHGRSAIRTCSAQTSARALGGAQAVWTTRRGIAKPAGRNSLQTDTAKPAPVVGRVETVSAHGRSSRVYDLTVEGDHEFYAEGVLVHNCIDAIRYATERLHRKGKLIAAVVAEAQTAPTDYGGGVEEDADNWKVA